MIGDHPIVGRRRLLSKVAGATAVGLVGTTLIDVAPASAAVPDDGSVTPSKFADSAKDPDAAVAGARTLGPGPRQAAPGTVVGEVQALEAEIDRLPEIVSSDPAKAAFSNSVGGVVTFDVSKLAPLIKGLRYASASTTVAAHDLDGIILVGASAAVTVTLPNDTATVPVGSTVLVCRSGAGPVSLTGTPAIVSTGGSQPSVREQWAVCAALRTHFAWLVFGDIA